MGDKIDRNHFIDGLITETKGILENVRQFCVQLKDKADEIKKELQELEKEKVEEQEDRKRRLLKFNHVQKQMKRIQDIEKNMTSRLFQAEVAWKMLHDKKNDTNQNKQTELKNDLQEKFDSLQQKIFDLEEEKCLLEETNKSLEEKRLELISSIENYEKMINEIQQEKDVIDDASKIVSEVIETAEENAYLDKKIDSESVNVCEEISDSKPIKPVHEENLQEKTQKVVEELCQDEKIDSSKDDRISTTSSVASDKDVEIYRTLDRHIKVMISELLKQLKCQDSKNKHGKKCNCHGCGCLRSFTALNETRASQEPNRNQIKSKTKSTFPNSRNKFS